MSHPPFVAHDPKHVEPEEDHPRRTALTTVPEFRYEYSFLKSVRPYFRLEGKGKEKEGDDAAEPGDALEIQWQDVAWVTTRDQVLSPLVQGALWAIASHLFAPLLGQARSFIPSPPEGGIVKWLRGWVHSSGMTSSRDKPPASKSYTRS